MQQLYTIDKYTDILELCELYRAECPANFLGYNTLKNFVKWYKKDSQLPHTKIYTLDKHWRQHGLYLIVERFQLFVNALLPGDQRLAQALKLLDWSRGYKITSIPKSHYNTVVNVLNELKINWSNAQLNVYRLSRENALNETFSIPDDYEVHPLNSHHAKLINEYWPSRQTGSLAFIRRLIEFNMSVGVYTCEKQQLVAWCTRCQCGFLGTLHVLEPHRRKGLAKLVINAYAKMTTDMGEHVYTLVHHRNHASNMLFQNFGFQLIDEAYHVRAYTVPETEIWPYEE